MITFKDLSEKLVDVTQRKKASRRMAKLAKTPSFQLKKKKSLLKRRDTAKLIVVAKKQVVNKFRKKFAPDYKNMSPQERVLVDQKIQQKYGAKIAKIAKKVAVKLKAKEGERVQKAKAAYKAGKETE